MAVASETAPHIKQLTALFAEHHKRVLLAAYRITGNRSDAEDVAQTVFLRLASTNELLANAGSYLYRAAINGALDLLRQRQRAAIEPLEEAGELAAPGPTSSPEAQTSSRELGTFLRKEIATLPPRAAEMFVLRYVEEWNNREIAAALGTSQAVVAVTLFHARSTLKKRLRDFGREKS